MNGRLLLAAMALALLVLALAGALVDLARGRVPKLVAAPAAA